MILRLIEDREGTVSAGGATLTPPGKLCAIHDGNAMSENRDIKQELTESLRELQLPVAAHPSARWPMNCIHFHLAMLAYNLNCWLMLFNREEQAKVDALQHTTLATTRLKFLFLAARIWRHRVGISYSDHYADQPLFERLMNRLRAVAATGMGFAPLIATALLC